MFQRILVPVDLSDKSLTAVDAAYEMATQWNSEVTVLHVIETVEHVAFEEMKDFYARLETSAQAGLQECAEKFTMNDMRINQVVIYGHRTEQIVDFAIRNSIDLIITASHRIDPDRPGHDWSSISYAVAIMSPCPVLLLK
jgi:nucleotide-binding universal stress UspA family protein